MSHSLSLDSFVLSCWILAEMGVEEAEEVMLSVTLGTEVAGCGGSPGGRGCRGGFMPSWV